MQKLYNTIRDETKRGNVAEARRMIDEALCSAPDDRQLHYLKGCTYLKTGHWRDAINCFMLAREPEGDGPACEMLGMLERIMAFRDKDRYNP